MLICDAFSALLTSGVYFACYCVGKVYLEGRKPSGVPLNRPAWTAASRIRHTKGKGDVN